MARPLRFVLPALIAATLATPLQAACFADYRAKMDNPLRLHYGVIEIPEGVCDVTDAAPVIAERIATGGWDLLEVISVFDEAGLDRRRADAAGYFLAF